MDDAGDQKVISAVLAGDVDAYAILIARYQKRIFNLMFRMTGSQADAADLTQEAFIKAYEKLHCFQKGKNFYPWIYTIGLNHSRNFLRQNKAYLSVPIEDCDSESQLHYPAPQEDAICNQFELERLNEALSRLPVDYREAVVLRYHEELSMDEIAEALGLSLSGAKMRVHRGLLRLREILDESNNECKKGSSSKKKVTIPSKNR